MVRERSTRVSVNLEAELIAGDKCFHGIIDNLSNTGLHMTINQKNIANNFPPGTPVEVEFQRISAETLKPIDEKLMLNCKVIRAEKTAPGRTTTGISLEVIEPSSLYEEFLKLIHCTHLEIL
jgi:hypothetical protein